MSYESTKDREIKRDTRTGIYFYRGTPMRGAGEKKYSLAVRTFGSAVLAKKDLLLRLRGIDPKARDILFGDYAKVFLEERKKKAAATFEQAFYSIQEMLPFFEHYTMKQIGDLAWGEYVAYQTELKPGRNLRYDRRHLRMMMMRLKRRGVVSEIPDLPYEDEGPKRRRVLTKDEISALFQAATPQSTSEGLLYFMYFMGTRPMEALGAAWSEFDLEQGIWHLPAERTKTRQARAMKLAPKVHAWLKVREQKSPQWVFPSREHIESHVDRYNKQWGKLLAKAGLSKEIQPYFLRHTFLTECAKKVCDGKISLVLITKYAGTSIEQFEKTYLHVDGQDTKAVSELMEL